jgi:fatty-acyl-CoA synthase
MQDAPLLISSMLDHGRRVYSSSRIITFEGDGDREATYAEVGDRAIRLAGALRDLGVGPGDRVGTFLWNTQEHFEAYLAVPSMGAVLHTLNLRLFPEQLAYVINHAEDKVVIVDASILPLLLKVADQLTTVEQYVLVGSASTADLALLGWPVHRYEDLLATAPDSIEWPTLDERTAAAMCYTSGTTGNPKGVVYSHRSTYLHSLASGSGNTFAITENDTILPVVPMFHANAWGLPYAGWMAGADFVLPGRHLQAEPLATMIETYKPTLAGAVPTIWNDLLNWIDEHPTDMSSLRLVPCGGSAVPLSLMKAYQERHGVRIVQAWGMTETSPLAAIAVPPKGYDGDEWAWRSKTGRVLAGVELRVVGEDGVLPWDGDAVGEIQVRGPWITGAYHLDPDPEKFDDGWLRTGDVASVTADGFVQITDRAKDVIKSGGEWISSVDLENALMGHPSVREAAVVAVPDDRWDERPLACVVLRDGQSVKAEELCTYLEDKVAKWWLPERWAFIPEVPKTSVGKFDKKVLRRQYADGELQVDQL